jgi:hypothetical protein
LNINAVPTYPSILRPKFVGLIAAQFHHKCGLSASQGLAPPRLFVTRAAPSPFELAPSRLSENGRSRCAEKNIQTISGGEAFGSRRVRVASGKIGTLLARGFFQISSATFACTYTLRVGRVWRVSRALRKCITASSAVLR